MNTLPSLLLFHFLCLLFRISSSITFSLPPVFIFPCFGIPRGSFIGRHYLVFLGRGRDNSSLMILDFLTEVLCFLLID